VGDHLVNGVIDQITQEPDESIGQKSMDAFVGLHAKKRKLVISDVKTRVSLKLPRERNSRSHKIQLSLYRQLLADMVDGNIDISTVFSRLKLDPDVVFGDGFLAEAGEAYSKVGIISFDQLLENNTLSVLTFRTIKLMKETMANCSERTIYTPRMHKRQNGDCNSTFDISHHRNTVIKNQGKSLEQRRSTTIMKKYRSMLIKS
jgi:hypothetical protein